MSHCLPSRPLLKIAALFFGLFIPAVGQEPAAPSEERKIKPQLRFVCVSSLAENQEVVLASKDDKGDWLELGTVGLRPSFITDWLPAKAGELHLALREKGTLKSICRFKYPETTRRALVVLIADPQRKVYLTNVVDPTKMGFTKGSVLIVNFSSQPGLVILGTNKLAVGSGKREVAKPGLESNGMYRMMVAYLDADKKPVPCYDRYISGNPDSRDILFLLPDPTLGLKVFSLPLFGEIE